mgnify:CR=1 FL=1
MNMIYKIAKTELQRSEETDVVLLACRLVGFDYIYVSIGDDFLRDD